MAQPLSRRSAANLVQLNRTEFKTGIVHIGLGNFHRAHFAVYTAKAMDRAGGDWGICAFTFRNKELVENLKAQDNLYSVLEIGPGTEKAYLPNAHTEFVVGYDQVDYISELISKKSTKIISLTITEAGYYLDQKSGGLNLEHPDIKNDLAGDTPRTIYGLILNGLLKRNGEPISILSCDNISHNGDLLKKLLSEFADKIAPDLASYLENRVSFPNSMVDRIVPGTEAKHLLLAENRLGVIDLAPVPCEEFSMWALEDKFLAGRPDWPEVIFTNEVSAFEQMKLMLLNGSHSLLAYLGGLLNCQTIPDCRFHPKVELALRAAIANEFLPATQMPTNISADTYIAQLFERWSNTVLADKTHRVGSDGSTKLPQRITKPSIRLLSKSIEPRLMALTVAAWMACIAPLNQEKTNEVCASMKDPNKEVINSLSKVSPESFVGEFFTKTNIFDESLSQNAQFVESVLKYRKQIYDFGVEAAIDSVLLST